MNSLIITTIFLLFFPIWVRFQGKDAITTGSIAIILSFFVFLIHALLTKKVKFHFLIIMLLLIIVATISANSISPQFLGPSFRGYAQFVCALLAFFMVTNHYYDLPLYKRQKGIESILSYIIVLFVIQVIIGTILYYYPSFGYYLKIFTTRTEDVFATPIASGVKRLHGIIVAQETFGEILAMLMPLVLYKIIKKEWPYYFVYGIFAVGVVLSATRSSIFLFFVGSLIFIIINWKLVKLPAWLIPLYIITLAAIIFYFYTPHAFDPIFNRFTLFFDLYEKTRSITIAIDRKTLWDIAVQEVFTKLNLFGHGMITVIANQQFSIHNLFLTVLFQMGIVGFVLFFGLMGKIFISLITSLKYIQNPYDRCLLISSIISLVIFLLSEMKCEFNRGSSYQQIVWILLGIYYLAAMTLREKQLINNTRTS